MGKACQLYPELVTGRGISSSERKQEKREGRGGEVTENSAGHDDTSLGPLANVQLGDLTDRVGVAVFSWK